MHVCIYICTYIYIYIHIVDTLMYYIYIYTHTCIHKDIPPCGDATYFSALRRCLQDAARQISYGRVSNNVNDNTDFYYYYYYY